MNQNAEAMKLPDSLLVRYYRAGEIDAISHVDAQQNRVHVTVNEDGRLRTDRWRDLGGGIGYVPSED